MDWKGVLAITVAILIALFTNRWWLPTLLKTLGGRRIEAMWAGKEYKLTVDEAQEVLRKQESVILDDRYGITANLLRLPNVVGVELAPKITAGKETDNLAIRVKVTKKVPLFELRNEDIIPASIGEIPIDVVQEP